MWALAPHYPFTSGVFCAFLRHSGTCSSYLLSLLQPGCGMHTAKGPTPAPWEGRPQTTSCTAWPVPQLQPEGGACTLSCRQSQGTPALPQSLTHSWAGPATLYHAGAAVCHTGSMANAGVHWRGKPVFEAER